MIISPEVGSSSSDIWYIKVDLLALFAGFFLYIGASDLIPESHHAHPTFWTTARTPLGAAALFAVIRLANI